MLTQPGSGGAEYSFVRSRPEPDPWVRCGPLHCKASGGVEFVAPR